MSTDEEKDPPVPADLEGKMPRKVHDASRHDEKETTEEEPDES
ncbi:hypothetical protein QEH68_10055 [Paenarthrobacter sp. OM7]|uniref:Uncharacterized protein n=1 Tax=Paenarthrobacter sp. AMU7 TaxID=3162492 RepID=A0AB39YUE6_9MICC|nr:hypothetical protein [Paenarthrobacter sp. OM7]WGM22486.1 hypothetical protein QEH68_10055 [Paenarthrobacter sp. OM7]